jgi:hypothetical protein
MTCFYCLVLTVEADEKVSLTETELQYQYLNYITGIAVLYKILKKIHNTGKKNYISDRQVQEIPDIK